ncbi:TonB-dependent receptor [Spirosoma migulaei]
MKRTRPLRTLALVFMKTPLVQGCILLLLFAGMTYATTVDAQSPLDRQISLQLEDVTIKNILKTIEREADVEFMYSDKLIQAKRKVSLNVANERLSAVLEKLLRPLQLSYQLTGKRILLNSAGPEMIQPLKTSQVPMSVTADRIVTGTVTDDTGEGLPGVSVVVKGSQRGTTTDAQGQYRLTVPEEGTPVLVFSFVGYQSQEVPLGNSNQLSVKLVNDNKTLNEVVVVGYGTQKREAVTAAIASVPMSELRDMPVSNAATALQGKIAGVVVQQNNGTPGSTPAIKVRGFGSISAGNSPLIVVDGNIVDANVFSLLNSNDIESIDVLKDASSAAIYGSKGSNGVILVTTKRGKNGKTNVNLDVYTGFQEVTKKLDLLNSQQFAEFGKESSNTAYIENVPGASINDPNSVRPTSYLRYRYPRGDLYDWFNFDDPTRVANLPYNNYQDMIFRKAKISNYQLGVSGGTDKARYLISGGYLKQDGIIKGSTLDRYTLRANVDVNITPELRVGLNINPSFKQQQEVTAEGHWANNGIINAALSAMPMAPIYAADGTTYSSQTELAAPYNYPGITNPIANITENHSQYQQTNLLANTYVEYSFLKAFKYRASGNINYTGYRRNGYRTSRIPLNQLLPPNAATGRAESEQGLSWLFNQTLTYSKTFNDAHNLDVLVGMESTRYQYQYSLGTGSSYANDVVETLNASANGTTSTITSSARANASTSYFARLNYNYKSRYLANVSVRRDGSSIFGPENRWGTFPAGSLGWRFTEESFMKGIRALSEGKLRVAYGFSGNNAFGNDFYPYAATLRSDNYSYNNALANGLAPGSLGNSKLGWEKSQQFDAGIDLGLLNNRIYLIVDYYQRITKDLLLSVNVPTVTGFSSAVKNIGKMENKGWEFALNTRNITGAFVWNTSANLSFNRNKVLALGPTGDPIRSNSGVDQTNITQIGSPIGSFYGYKQIGIFQSQADLNSYPHDATAKPGDVKFEDVNGDGKITADDRTIIGNNQPKFIYSMTNSFSYKGFDLNIALQGTQGGQVLNLSRRFFENLEGNANQITTVLTRWRSESNPGDGVTPRANARTTGNNNAVSSRWVEDGSYLRIQNISLGYQLPKALLNKAKIQQARVYVSAQNLHTWTKYLNYNPEVSNYEGPLTGGVDYGYYPLAKTFTIGLNLGF